MNRRDTLVALSALLALHPYAHAQPPAKIARVGILALGSPESNAVTWKPAVEALEALGWKEGRNLVFVTRYAPLGGADLPKLAAEMLQLKPDVILCGGPAPAVTLKDLNTQIPCVFVIVASPVQLGLAQSLGRPGGMFTGLSTLAPEFILAKQVELLRETVPRATRLAYLTNPDNPVHAQGRELRLKVVGSQGLKVIEVHARSREELETAFAEAGRQKAEFMYLSGDQVPMLHRDLVARLALKYRLPVMFLFFEHVEAGGLMSYGIDRAELTRAAATYVDRILKGAMPRDLPIEEPTKYTLVINMKTAKALGITIPQTVLLRADRVIE